MKKQAEKGKLRILAFSDLHGSEMALRILAKKAKKADVVLCAGDFTVFEHNILRIMRKLDSFGKPVMLVNGNHEDEMLVAEICRTLKNVKFVHRRVYGSNKFPNYVFIGHGGEGFDAISEDFERFSASAMKKIKLLKPKAQRSLGPVDASRLGKQGKKIIFITHQPPHNTKVDYIWAHHGNKSYARFVKKVQPLLHVCGHLHETQGKKDKIGATKIINPGPKGQAVEV